MSIPPSFSAPPAPHILIFGLGYVGRPLALSLLTHGCSVTAVTRHTPDRVIPGLTVLPSHPPTPSLLAPLLPTVTHILSTVPPGSSRDPVLCHFQSHLLRSAPKFLAYLSTTSIYGDHSGALVSEHTPPAPPFHPRVRYENQWCDFAASLRAPFYLFRLGGIYGPNRNTLHSLLRRPPSASPSLHSQLPVSLIHIDDIVSALTAAILEHPLKSAQNSEPIIFNLVDDCPTSRARLILFSHSLIDQAGLDLDTLRASFAGAQENASFTQNRSTTGRNRDRVRANKRVSNAKMKRLLVRTLKYPTYEHGLLAEARRLFPGSL